MSLLGLLQALFGFAAKALDYLSGERLRKLGHLEANSDLLEKERQDTALAKEVDSRPAVLDKSVLDRLLPPA